MRRRARVIALAFALLSVVALLLSDRPAEWLVLEDPPAAVDAVVVMAGDPDYERTRTAAALVRSGQARLLVVTGGEPGPGDSAQSLRGQALGFGVPADRIRLEASSRSTRESVVALVGLIESEKLRTVALVTSPYHQRRAYLAARKAWPGVSIRNRPASPASWSAQGWWRQARSRRPVLQEYAKLLYYVIRGWA